MPSVKGIAGPYRFYFYSFDCNEPKHVHVRRERMVCKFWLDPLALAQTMASPPESSTRFGRIFMSTWRTSWRHGMSTAVNTDARIKSVEVSDDMITAYLADGRVISVPLSWSWRLSEATPVQRANYE